jgi:hypothetical protein
MPGSVGIEGVTEPASQAGVTDAVTTSDKVDWNAAFAVGSMYMSNLRRVLVEKGVFIDDGESYRLAQDYSFDSPSTAAGVLLGRSANGRIEWKDASGRSLKELQEAAAGD